jgi:hypothetical protein
VFGHIGRVCLWGAGLGLLVAIAVVLAAVTLLVHGPVEVETAADAARRVLAEVAGPGGRSSVGSARLDWSFEDGLSVALSGIAVERDGVLAVDLPRVDIRLRLLPILHGDVKPRSLVFIDPKIRIDVDRLAAPTPATGGSAEPVPAAAPPAATAGGAGPRSATGAEAATTAGAVVADDAMRRIAEVLGAAVGGVVEKAVDGGLASIGLTGGTVEMLRTDAAGTVHHVFVEEVAIESTLGRETHELQATLSARGEVGRWSATVALTRLDGNRRRLDFAAKDLSRLDFLGPPKPGFDLSMPFSPSAGLEYGSDGRLSSAVFDLKAGAGKLRFGNEPEDEILLDEAAAHVVWRPQNHDFIVSGLDLSIGETNFEISGRVAPAMDGSGRWDVDLGLGRGTLKPRDVSGSALVLDSGTAHLSIDPATRLIDVRELSTKFGAGWVRSAGALDLSGEEPKLKLDIAFSPLSTERVKRAWPHWVAPDARTWFIQNVGAGRVSDMTIALDMPRMDRFETWPGNAVAIDAKIEGLRFHGFGKLPEIASADGRLTLADRRFDFVADHAQVATRAAKHPSVDGFRFTIPDIFAKPPKGSIRFQVSGETGAIAEIADADPIAALAQVGIKTDGLGGTAVVGVGVDLSLSREIDGRSIEWKVDAQLDRFSNTVPIQGRKFQDGKARIVADPRGTRVTGRAQVDGIAADIDLYEANGGNRSGEKREFRMVLDDAARQRLGLDFGGFVQGAMTVTVSQAPGNDNRRRIEADLGPAKLTVAAAGWTKGSGVPAKASLDEIDDDKGTRIDNLVIESEGFAVRGSLQFDRDKRLIGADFGRFALRRGDDAKVKVTRAADGLTTATVEATTFDLRGLLLAQRRSESGSTDKGADFNLRLKAGRLIGFNDTDLGDVTADLQIRGGVVASGSATAKIGGGRPVRASIEAQRGLRRLRLDADDAGAMLSFLDLFDRIKGGRLWLDNHISAPGVSTGSVRITEFRLFEEPKSGRIAQPTTDADGSRKIQVRKAEFDRSTDFDRASAHFAMHDGVIDVTDAIAKGKSVGATASGQIDVTGQRVALSGTYIPAFGINNLAGQIPILGAITGAGSNGGLVGVTFRVTGPIEDPILQINPLSAIAPGIFRKIFEFQSEDPAPPRGDPNAPTRITP